MAAHADRAPSAGFVPHPAYGLHAPEAVFNPVAAGIQSGLRQRYLRVGQKHPAQRLTVGVQHDQGAVQRLVAEGPPGAHHRSPGPVVSVPTGTRWVWPSS